MRRRFVLSLVASSFFVCLAVDASSVQGEEPAAPEVVQLHGLPATEGRQLFASDETGNAYIVQLRERAVYEIDETGQAHYRLTLASDEPIGGALRAATGNGGKTWIFGFAPWFVRVFRNGEEVEIERIERTVTGMTVTGGRPTLSVIPGRTMVGTNLERERSKTKTPPIVVQLDSKGRWQPWIDYEPDGTGLSDFLNLGALGQETRLAGDSDGRLAMARTYRYWVREYSDSGRLENELKIGELEEIELPEPDEQGRIYINRKVAARPAETVNEGVAWSPDGEILVLTKPESGGYALDRWLPALQERHRLPVPELDDQRRIQMVAGRTGLMLLPHNSTRLVVLPWEYLREAEWENLTGNEDIPETPNWAEEPDQKASEARAES